MFCEELPCMQLWTFSLAPGVGSSILPRLMIQLIKEKNDAQNGPLTHLGKSTHWGGERHVSSGL